MFPLFVFILLCFFAHDFHLVSKPHVSDFPTSLSSRRFKVTSDDEEESYDVSDEEESQLEPCSEDGEPDVEPPGLEDGSHCESESEDYEIDARRAPGIEHHSEEYDERVNVYFDKKSYCSAPVLDAWLEDFIEIKPENEWVMLS